MKKEYGTSGEAAYKNMTRAHCMLGSQVYEHKLRICSRPTDFFSIATMVTRMRLIVTLYVQYIASLLSLAFLSIK